jgi:hypothetical protein
MTSLISRQAPSCPTRPTRIPAERGQVASSGSVRERRGVRVAGARLAVFCGCRSSDTGLRADKMRCMNIGARSRCGVPAGPVGDMVSSMPSAAPMGRLGGFGRRRCHPVDGRPVAWGRVGGPSGYRGVLINKVAWRVSGWAEIFRPGIRQIERKRCDTRTSKSPGEHDNRQFVQH